MTLGLDDGHVYSVDVAALIEANHRNQHQVGYWRSYSEWGQRFARSFNGNDENDISDNDPSVVGLLEVWRNYSEGDHKHCKPDEELPIVKRRLLTYHRIQAHGTDGMMPLQLIGRSSAHCIMIDGCQWDYQALDGNHRLIAGYFCGVQSVPVLLVSEPHPVTAKRLH